MAATALRPFEGSLISMDATLGSESGARLRQGVWPARALSAVALLTIPASYFAQRAIITALGAGVAPLVVIPEPKAIPPAAAVALTLLALVQCGGLALLVRGRVPLSAAIVAGLALTAISLTQSTSFSSDPYSYVGYGALPTFADGYAPPSLDLDSDFDRVYEYEGRPLITCLYGPLWLSFDRLLLAGSHSVAESLLRLRCINVVWWAALVALFASRRETRGAAPLLAANPAIASCYVADAHVDIGGVTMLVAAALFGTRRWWLAGMLALGAGLWKITLAPLVLCVVPPQQRLRAFALVAGVVALTVGLSLAWGGRGYVDALLHAGNSNTARGIKGIAHAVLVLAAGGALLVALFGAAKRWTMWLPMSLGANLFPWYSIWALPLALRARGLAPFCIAWPLVAVTTDTFSPPLGYAVLIALTAAVALADSRALRARAA
jgi:hypothetical protein